MNVGRLAAYLGVFRALRTGGVRPLNILLYPVRRRLSRENRLRVKGLQLSTSREEPLLHIFSEIFAEDRYYRLPLRSGDDLTVVDVGAHAGLFAASAALRYPRGRVVSVEPSPRLMPYLWRNTIGNGLKNVVLHGLALGGKPEVRTLFRRGCEGMNTLYSRDLYASTFSPGDEITAITLPDLFDVEKIERCDLLKLDCEGAEYEILFSCPAQTLEKIQAISMEYHLGLTEHTAQSMSDFLSRAGFEVRVEPPLDVEGGYLYAWRPA